MAREDLTEAVILLDRSGSMRGIREYVLAELRKFMAEQSRLPGEIRWSLYTFDTPPAWASLTDNAQFPEVAFSQIVGDRAYVEDHHFQPRGNTALYLAQANLIDRIGQQLAAVPESQRPGRVAFMTVTDGEDNTHSQYKSVAAQKIQHQTEKYNWAFSYMGANQDAEVVGTGMNVARASSLTYTATREGLECAFSVANAAFTGYRSGATKGIELNPISTSCHD